MQDEIVITVIKHIPAATGKLARPSAPPSLVVPNAFQLNGNLADDVDKLIGFVNGLARPTTGSPIQFLGIGVAPNNEVPVAISVSVR